MSRLFHVCTLIVLFTLTACGAHRITTQSNPATGFPYRHSNFDYKVAWKTTEAKHTEIIEGIIKNVRYPYIDSLDITIFVMGPDGKTRARTSTIPVPQRSEVNETIHFNAELPNVSFVPGDTLLFSIHYLADLGGHDIIDWHSTFAVDAITGAPRHTEDVEPDTW